MKQKYIRAVACNECGNFVPMDEIKNGVFRCPVCGRPMVVREGELFKLYKGQAQLGIAKKESFLVFDTLDWVVDVPEHINSSAATCNLAKDISAVKLESGGWMITSTNPAIPLQVAKGKNAKSYFCVPN